MKTSFEKFMASSAVNKVELGEMKVDLATADQLDNLTGNLVAQIKQIDQLTTQIKTALPLINKGVNLIATVESGQELIQKELSAFRVDARKLGLMADEIPQWKNLNNTLVASMRSLGGLIASIENVNNVSKKV
jgi:hypothetical protein